MAPQETVKTASVGCISTPSRNVLYLTPHGDRAGAERMLDVLIRGHEQQQSLRFHAYVVVGTDGVFARRLLADGVRTEIHQLRLSQLYESVRWLRNYIVTNDIAIVHSTMSHYHQFAWLATRGLGVPCLWVNHGPCPTQWWKGVAHALPADATVAVGQFVKQCHRGFSLAPDPELIRYGLEDSWYRTDVKQRQDARREWNIPDGMIAVGALSRIERWKRQHCLLEAIARLPQQAVEKALFFIGGEPSLGRGSDYYEELKALHEKNPYRDRIRLSGYTEADKFWEAMDIGVHCAEAEPFGLAVLEPMAKGKLVIASNGGGVPEMITSGANGFLQDPTDYAGFAAVLERCINKFDTLSPMRHAARESAHENFSAKKLIDSYEDLYCRLLAR